MHPSHPIRAALVAALVTCASANAAPVTLRVQAAAEPNGNTSTPAIAGDGRSVVFRSSATNFGAGTLFAYATGKGTITALAPTANAPVFDPSVSTDGSIVAFETGANNLGNDMDSGFADVFVLDRGTGTFQLASRGFGFIAPDGGSGNPAVSGDGRYVAFDSLASNLVAPSTTANRRHIFVYDRQIQLVELVTHAGDDPLVEGNKPSASLEPSAFSADGSKLVFTSEAENIAPVFLGNVQDVFVMTRDPSTRQMTYETVNRSAAGEVGNLSSSRGSISANGRYVVFRTGANNILPPNGSPSDLYVRDLPFNTLRAVPLPAGFMSCDRARVADSGDVVMRCAPIAPATAQQVFVAPANGSAPRLLSAALGGGAGNASSGESFTISADGAIVALESAATDLVPGDLNVAIDTFLIGEPGALDRLFSDGFE